ncbi:MAG TPA: hypothetical protein VJA47_03240 [archaeon]|nr:hypothetical protein [archaeon]
MSGIQDTWQSYMGGEVGRDMLRQYPIDGVRCRSMGGRVSLTVELDGSRQSLPIEDRGSDGMKRVYSALSVFADLVQDKRNVEIHLAKGASTKHYKGGLDLVA